MPQRATNLDAQQRWIRVRNTTDEIIPPYACMELTPVIKNGTANHFFCAEESQGHIVYTITKPTSEGAASQDSTRFVFNGPNRIEKKGRGRATVDFPCQALHDGTSNEIYNYDSCGPQEDSWCLWSSGWAYRAVTHCPANGYEDRTRGQRVHTMWVTLGQKRTNARVTARINGQSIGPNEIFTPLGSNVLEQVGFDYEPSVSPSVAILGFRPQVKARYIFGCQATIYASPSVARGTLLGMRAYVYDEGTQQEDETLFSGHRYHDLESIGTGEVIATTAENVAFGGSLTLDTDQQIRIRNYSTETIIVEQWQFWIELLREVDGNFRSPPRDPVDNPP